MRNRSRVRGVTPLFMVSDLRSSVSFYCHKLGFADPTTYGNPPCFAVMRRDGFELMLSSSPDAPARPNGTVGVWDMYVSVEDVSKEIAALAANGVTVAKGPTDTFYRMREIEVLDPDGHRICLAQSLS